MKSPVEDDGEAPLCSCLPFSSGGGSGSGFSGGMGRPYDEDPLTLALAPPPNETPEQRHARELAEEQAKKISDEIDEQLKREKENGRKGKKPVKLLLLGQSESGKTATLKNFQLTYARREWSEERASWRTVILLNFVRNINLIVENLTQEMSGVDPDDSDGEDSQYTRKAAKALQPLRFKEKHRLLKGHLECLEKSQADLEKQLGEAASEVTSVAPFNVAAPFDIGGNGRKRQEFSINSNNGWKPALRKFKGMRSNRTENGDSESGALQRTKDVEDDVLETLAGCREHIKDLWEDSTVHEMLNRRKLRLEDAPGFFLNDIDRIAMRHYQPTDDDVVRARLRTLGVQEYRFIFDHGRTAGQEWRLYDVGGTRSSRAAWFPYFDDVDAIIFLAPISPFDEKLAEDRKVNRLEDSYLLWRSVCSQKLLARTQIILFLNKCDLLQAKLQRGVRIRDSVPSFGDRKNDLQTVTKYFQQHFKDISKQVSPVPRPFYMYLTSVIDTKSTAVTLGAVEESILRQHLRHADLM